METAAAYIVALLVVLVLLVVAAFAWYHQPSKWKSFSYVGGDVVTFVTGTTPLGRLRFKGCTFTTANPANTPATWDVTGVLNGMSAAYDIPVGKYELSLGGSAKHPLNPFSFTKVGFNDITTVPTAAANNTWAAVPNSATTLTGMMRLV